MHCRVGKAEVIPGNTTVRQPTSEEMVTALVKIFNKSVQNHLEVLFGATRKSPEGGWETPFDVMVRGAIEKILRERLLLTSPPDDLLP